jgi:hypothetical protein
MNVAQVDLMSSAVEFQKYHFMTPGVSILLVLHQITLFGLCYVLKLKFISIFPLLHFTGRKLALFTVVLPHLYVYGVSQ